MATSGSNDFAKFRRALRHCAPQLRRGLPWINHPDPWAILVSEVMLQQTQTARVLEPWRRFLDRFPTPSSCANSPLSSVLQLWSGLGYHRRAKALHEASRMIRDQFAGRVPSDVIQLRRLPGVGEYTAHAVASFALDRPVAVLDTNVGRVLARGVANRPLRRGEAQRMAEDLLPRSDVASFNQAMIDLGAQFCRSVPRCELCPMSHVCRWRNAAGPDPALHSAGVSRPQSKFEGSTRQLRGYVLADLRQSSRSHLQLSVRFEGVNADHFEEVLEGLLRDGLIERRGLMVRLATSPE